MVFEEADGLPSIKLIDFNVAKRFRDEATGNKLYLMTNTGAVAFTAPEIHNKESYT
jgi:serine/threonine protein kinase